ncbi:uncharacterized protein BP5553_00925 [Venustampulla echinocandica]|uniref:Uncharacterized protein n=1 Tax=Venustampulla echinocandica TaxID=2656787 RepID=A0A370TZJ1_9HELO|nr:uncharacterized protein BP5553_00925 [Venustampulla echinocandica]RDL40946.1 hypothetical protein BP5553_00925 [Venustampulla echinocandica]
MKSNDADMAIRTKLGAALLNSPSDTMAMASSDAEKVSAKLDAGLRHQCELAQIKKEKKLEKKRKRHSGLHSVDLNGVDDEDLRIKKIKTKKERKDETSVVKKDEKKAEMEPPKTPTKKHKKKKSKDDREDARRSPATLKLLKKLEDWYDSSSDEEDEEMIVADQKAVGSDGSKNPYEYSSGEEADMDDENEEYIKNSFITSDSQIRQVVKSEELMRTILYPKVTAQALEKSNSMTEARLSTSKGELLRTILHPKVAVQGSEKVTHGHKLFNDLDDVFTSTPTIKPQGCSINPEGSLAKASRARRVSLSRDPEDYSHPIRQRKAGEVVENWEENPGTVRGMVQGHDDTEMEENIAFSEHYITTKSNQSIQIGQSTYSVVKISPGAGCSLTIEEGFKFCFKFCTVARGGPVLVCLGPKGKETRLKCQEGGMWRVRSGDICEVVNESDREVVIFTFVSGEHED